MLVWGFWVLEHFIRGETEDGVFDRRAEQPLGTLKVFLIEDDLCV